MCSWKDCDIPISVGGLCNTHNQRLRGQSKLPMDAPVVHKRGKSFESLNRHISYSAAHDRVRWFFGKASNYSCVDCGGRARDWSYDGTDPTEFIGFGTGRQKETLHKYSIWPEYYAPRCRRCHINFDYSPAEIPEDAPPW